MRYTMHCIYALAVQYVVNTYIKIFFFVLAISATSTNYRVGRIQCLEASHLVHVRRTKIFLKQNRNLWTKKSSPYHGKFQLIELFINKVVATLLDWSLGFHEKSAKSAHATHIFENSTFYIIVWEQKCWKFDVWRVERWLFAYNKLALGQTSYIIKK